MRRLLGFYLAQLPAQVLEKIAIFIDIARLTVIVLLMRDRRDRVYIVHRFLASQIVIVILLGSIL